MGQIQVDAVVAINAQSHFSGDLPDGPGGDVARHCIAIARIPFLQKIKAFGLWDLLWLAWVAGVFRYPDAATLAARRL